MVKQNLINCENKKKLDKIISKSSLIVLFGVSIGITDTTYWNLLHNWLKENKNRKVVFYTYDTSYIAAKVQPTVDSASENIIDNDEYFTEQIIPRFKYGTKEEKIFKFKRAVRKKHIKT